MTQATEKDYWTEGEIKDLLADQPLSIKVTKETKDDGEYTRIMNELPGDYQSIRSIDFKRMDLTPVQAYDAELPLGSHAIEVAVQFDGAYNVRADALKDMLSQDNRFGAPCEVLCGTTTKNATTTVYLGRAMTHPDVNKSLQGNLQASLSPQAMKATLDKLHAILSDDFGGTTFLGGTVAGRQAFLDTLNLGVLAKEMDPVVENKALSEAQHKGGLGGWQSVGLGA